MKVEYFRGPEDDVLDRYFQAARAFQAEVVVRITSDCPVVDPDLADRTIRAFHDQKSDYASNVIPRTYPRGLDTEVFAFASLERAWRERWANRTSGNTSHPICMSTLKDSDLGSLVADADYSRYRWTVDTREDLELLRTIYSRFNNADDFSWLEILQLMEREPELAEVNSQVLQKSVRGH